MNNTLPADFIESIKSLSFFDFDKYINSFTEKTPVSIRINPKKVSSLKLEKVKWSDLGYYLEERPEFILDPFWHSGTYYVQEAGSMFIEEILKQLGVLDNDIKILDLAAAPGGKSTHLLSLINDNSLLVSNEIIPKRASILEENLIRWGADNFILTNNKPSDFRNFSDEFDVVLVDAPCSGEGMFRKDVNTISEWSEDNVNNCSIRQLDILEDICHTIKENGYLIYSTCTFNLKENEEVIMKFTSKYDFEIIDINVSYFNEIVKNNNTLRFIPGITKSEGFVVTVLQKKYSDEKKNYKFKKITETDNPFPDLISIQSENLIFYNYQDNINLFNKENKDFLDKIISNLKVLTFGNKIAVSNLKNKSILLPDYNLATSVNISKHKMYEINDEDALRYLKGEVLRIDLKEKGYYFVTYKNQPIGLINNLLNRANNLYPDYFRIKKQVSYYEPIKSFF